MNSRQAFLGNVVKNAAYGMLPSWGAVTSIIKSGAGNEVTPKPEVNQFYIAVIDEFYVQPINTPEIIYRVKAYYATSVVRRIAIQEAKKFSAISHVEGDTVTFFGPYPTVLKQNKIKYKDLTIDDTKPASQWEQVKEKMSILTTNFASYFGLYCTSCSSLASSLLSSSVLEDSQEKLDLVNNNTLTEFSLACKLDIEKGEDLFLSGNSGMVEGSNNTVQFTDGIFQSNSKSYLKIDEHSPVTGFCNVIKFTGWEDLNDPILLDGEPVLDYNGNQMFNYKDKGKLTRFSLRLDDDYQAMSSFTVKLSSVLPTSISTAGEWEAQVDRSDGEFASVMAFEPMFGEDHAYEQVYLWIAPVFSLNTAIVSGEVESIEGYPSYEIPDGLGGSYLSASRMFPPYGYPIKPRVKIIDAQIETE